MEACSIVGIIRSIQTSDLKGALCLTPDMIFGTNFITNFSPSLLIDVITDEVTLGF